MTVATTRCVRKRFENVRLLKMYAKAQKEAAKNGKLMGIVFSIISKHVVIATFSRRWIAWCKTGLLEVVPRFVYQPTGKVECFFNCFSFGMGMGHETDIWPQCVKQINWAFL
jgi:hypothetical protein